MATPSILPVEDLEGDLDVVHRVWPANRPPQTFVEPVDSLVPRRFMRNPLVDSLTLGNVNGRMFLNTPERVIRRVHDLTVYFTASATVGARNLVLGKHVNEDRSAGFPASGTTLSLFNAAATVAPTAGQTAQIALGQNDTGVPVGGNTGVFRTIQRPFWLPEGSGLFLQDLANVDTADTFLVRGIVEEFQLVAVGTLISRSEIPYDLGAGVS